MKTKPVSDRTRINRLIRLPVLFALVLGVGVVLFLLFPHEQQLKQKAEERKYDALSIPYLQLLMRNHPEDKDIRYALASHLAAAGKGDEAKNLVTPLLNTDGVKARLALIDIDYAMLIAIAENKPEREKALASLVQQIEQLSGESMQPAALTRLADISMATGKPGLAAALYQKLAQTDQAKRQYWSERAASAFFQSEAPRKAALEYEAIAAKNQHDPKVQKAWLFKALDAYLAADDGKAALKLMDTVAEKFRDDREFMHKAATIALSQNDPARAQRFGRRLVAIAPDDPVVLAQQIDIELAGKNLPAALTLAQHLVALVPDKKNRTRLAQIAEWSGHPKVALEQWAILGELDPGGKEMAQAMLMASQMAEDALWLQMAAMVTTKRPLKSDAPEEEAALVAIHERNKVPKLLVAYLRPYLNDHPERVNLWTILSGALEQQGDIKGALAIWPPLVPKYVGTVDAAVRQAAILGRAKRPFDGLAKLQAVAVQQQVKNTDITYWQLYGDLAWDGKKNDEALTAYRIVWDNTAKKEDIAKAQVPVAERLIQLYNASGNATSAIAVARKAYARFGESRWLILAMESASQGSRWDELRELTHEAERDEAKFKHLEMYWLSKAAIASHDGKKSDARAAWHKALALNPTSVSTRVGLLWFEIDGGDKKQLLRHLKKWQPEAVENSDYWGPYAAGLLYLRKVKESIPWFARKARENPDDYLWLLGYADALAETGREDQAWRMRRYVFRRMNPTLSVETKALKPGDKKLHLAYASLLYEFDSPEAGDRILKKLLARGFDDADVYEALVAANIKEKKYDAAHQWLQHADAGGHKLPAWQTLSVALAQNDMATIAKVSDETDNTLSDLDRINALRRLGRNEQAMALTDKALMEADNRDRETLLQNKEELAFQLSRRAELGLEKKRYGDLTIDSGRLAGSTSIMGGSGRVGVQLLRNKLSSNENQLSVNGFRNENDLSVTADLLVKNDPMRFSLGVNQRSDNSLLYGRYEWSHRFTESASTLVTASVNNVTDETTALRAIGAKDKLSVAANVNLTNTEYARVELAGQHFHTRNGTTLGSGYRVAGELGSTIFRKIPLWRVRLSGSLERNQTVDQLPAELLGTILPLSTSVDSVVASRFSTVGVGTTVGFGDKDGLGRDPFVLVDAWVGRQWPGNSLAYSFRMSAGRPVFGPDRLSVEGYYSTNVQGGGQTGAAYSGVGLMYKYQF